MDKEIFIVQSNIYAIKLLKEDNSTEISSLNRPYAQITMDIVRKAKSVIGF